MRFVAGLFFLALSAVSAQTYGGVQQVGAISGIPIEGNVKIVGSTGGYYPQQEQYLVGASGQSSFEGPSVIPGNQIRVGIPVGASLGRLQQQMYGSTGELLPKYATTFEQPKYAGIGNIMTEQLYGASSDLKNIPMVSQTFGVPASFGLRSLASPVSYSQVGLSSFGLAHQLEEPKWSFEQQPKWSNIGMEREQRVGLSSSTLPVSVPAYVHASSFAEADLPPTQNLAWSAAIPSKWSSVGASNLETIPLGLHQVGISIPSDVAISQKIPVTVSLPGQVPFKAPAYSYANLVPGMQYTQLANTALPVNVRPTTFSQLPVISNAMLGLASTQMNTVQQAPTTTEQTTFVQNQPIVRATMMTTLPLQQIVNTQLPKFNLGSAQHLTTLQPIAGAAPSFGKNTLNPKFGISTMENQMIQNQADQLNYNMLNQQQ